jgi:membrane fusion protein (multidrug efflux system)
MKIEGFVRIISVAALLSTMGLLAVSCGEGKSRVSSRGNDAKGSKVPVNAVVIQPRQIENKIFTTGTLLANEEVELGPEISGRIVGVYFQEGGRVKKDQLLLKINDDELKAQFKRKELEEKLAADEERRKKSLYDISGISQEEYDKALVALKMIQAEKEVIQSQLAKTEIKAPFDGFVGLRYVSEGSYVTANVPVAVMQDVNPMKVEFSVPEKYARQVKKGTRVAVRVGDSQTEYNGEVYAVEAKVDPGTRTIKLRGRLPNPKEDLIPGAFAKVEITLERIPDAIVIPAEAVIPEINGEKVFICVDGKARSVPIKTGIRSGSDVQVLTGLNPSDTLVITGLLQIADGRAIELRELTDE